MTPFLHIGHHIGSNQLADNHNNNKKEEEEDEGNLTVLLDVRHQLGFGLLRQ